MITSIDPSSIIIKLMVGPTQPRDAPEDLLKALSTIEVTQGSRCPSGFRLSFHADRYPPKQGTMKDYPLLDTDLLKPFNRVQVVVQPEAGTPTVLIDGFITHQELTIEGEGKALVTVLGEDVSVKMDLVEVSAEYPNLADSAIVKQILGKYSSLGITAKVTAPSGESAPQDYVPQQNSTDRFYLQLLAARHGFQFYVQPGSSVGSNEAVWGPPVATGDRQKALTTNMGPANNLKSLSLRYDALAPTVAYGRVLDLTKTPAETVDVAVGSVSSDVSLAKTAGLASSASSLASSPDSYADSLSTLSTRASLLYHAGATTAETRSQGQGKVDRSTWEVVTAEGELDTAQYQSILVAPGLVDVRGVGGRYDGTYFVRQVRHLLSLDSGSWSYLQKFVLTRGGLDSTIAEVEES